MAGPNILSGALPNAPTSDTVTGWFLTDADTNSLQVSANGTTGWAASVTLAGGTLAHDSANTAKTARLQPLKFTAPTTVGLFSVWVRAVGPSGTGPAFQTTVRVYLKPDPYVGTSGEFEHISSESAAADAINDTHMLALHHHSAYYGVRRQRRVDRPGLAEWTAELVGTPVDLGVSFPYDRRVVVKNGFGYVLILLNANGVTMKNGDGTTYATIAAFTHRAVLAKIDVTTGQWQWHTICSANGALTRYQIAVDNSGSTVALVAQAPTSATSLTFGSTTLTRSAELGLVTAKFSAATGATETLTTSTGSVTSCTPRSFNRNATGGWTLALIGASSTQTMTVNGQSMSLRNLTIVSMDADMSPVRSFTSTVGSATYFFVDVGTDGVAAIAGYRNSGTSGVGTTSFTIASTTVTSTVNQGVCFVMFDPSLATPPTAYHVSGFPGINVSPEESISIKRQSGAAYIVCRGGNTTAWQLASVGGSTNPLGAESSVAFVGKWRGGISSTPWEWVSWHRGPFGGTVNLRLLANSDVIAEFGYGTSGSAKAYSPNTLSPIPTTTTFGFGRVYYSLDSEQGRWGWVVVPAPIPPGDNGYVTPPDTPVIDWPAVENEDISITRLATTRNPEDPAGELPYPGSDFTPTGPPVVDGEILVAPADLTATVFDRSVRLDFTAIEGVRMYAVYRDGILIMTPSAPLVGTAVSALVTNLTNGVAYTFEVRGYILTESGGITLGPVATITATPSPAGGTVTSDRSWTDLRWEAYDPTSRVWFTTPLDQFNQFQDHALGSGSGSMRIYPHLPAYHTDPDQPDYIPPYGAEISFFPTENWNGTFRALLRVVATRPDGLELVSSSRLLFTDYQPVYDPPQTPQGDMPDVDEGQTSVGSFTSFSPDGSALTWYLSPQTSDPRTTTSTTSVTVYDDDGLTPAGTASITSGQGSGAATISFTPVAHYFGTFRFSVRTGDGGDGIPGGNPGFSSWATVSVTVRSVLTPPSAPTPSTMPTMEEDGGFVTRTFTVTDFDVSPGGADPVAFWQVSPAGTTETARGDFVTIAAGLVEIISEEADGAEDDLAATVRFTPAADFHGSYGFYLRAWKFGGAGQPLYGAWTYVTGVVTPVADRPTAPQPRTMPLTKAGEPVSQIFTTYDPDDGPWTWQVSANGSTGWSSVSASFTAGTITVAGQGATTTTLVYTPADDYIGGRYEFWLRVSDSTSPTPLTSDAVRVTGFVSSAAPSGQLVLLTRTAGNAILRSLGTLALTELEVTESLTGPGGARVGVATDRLAAIAAAEGWSVEELLYPGGIELHINAGPLKLFAGPVASHFTAPDRPVTIIEADGLAGYLTSRAVEGNADVNFVAKRADQVMWELVDTEQNRAYGDLLLTNATSPTGNPFSVTFEAGTSITEAVEALSFRLGGPEWWVTAEREFGAAALRGSDRRTSVLLTDACSILERETDDAKLATVTDVEGDATAFGSAVAATAVLARFGRRYSRLEAERLDTNAGAAALAAQHVADFGTPVPTRRLRHFVQPGGVLPWDYEVGDAIMVENTSSGTVERVGVRVINRTLRLVGANAWLVEADVEVIGSGARRPARSRHLPRLYEQLYDAIFG
jgi:hypothetical protein